MDLCADRAWIAIAFVVIFSAFAGGPSVARSARAEPIAPRVVREYFAEMDRDCSEVGGRPDRRGHRHATYRFDFNGDGHKDWILDDRGFLCLGAQSIYTGHHGNAQVTVFVVRPNGSAFLTFRHGASGVFPPGTRGTRFRVGVGGRLCGQRATNMTPEPQLIRCRRPLIWNVAMHRVEFGPLSEIILDRSR